MSIRLNKNIKQRLVSFTYIFFIVILITAPLFVFAAPEKEPEKLNIFLSRLGWVLGNLTALVGAFAVLGFIVGVVKFIFHSGEEEKRKEGKKMIMWSIIALFIMVSIWGIVEILQSTVAIEEFNTKQDAPCLDDPFFGEGGCNTGS